jgi:hypothetical protein
VGPYERAEEEEAGHTAGAPIKPASSIYVLLLLLPWSRPVHLPAGSGDTLTAALSAEIAAGAAASRSAASRSSAPSSTAPLGGAHGHGEVINLHAECSKHREQVAAIVVTINYSVQ